MIKSLHAFTLSPALAKLYCTALHTPLATPERAIWSELRRYGSGRCNFGVAGGV
jgi:hypothetical protein